MSWPDGTDKRLCFSIVVKKKAVNVSCIICFLRVVTKTKHNPKYCLTLIYPFQVVAENVVELVEWMVALKKAARLGFDIPVGDPVTKGFSVCVSVFVCVCVYVRCVCVCVCVCVEEICVCMYV